jgi:tRNA pseudouridine13 synthase
MPSPSHALPDWQRAHGSPLFQGLIKQSTSEFIVTESLAFDFTGDGEHDYLWIEKQGANTTWVARGLARYAGIALRDVGYAGLKDRHAITRQWFSARRPSGAGTDWDAFDLEGVRILDTGRHQRKLKRGAHSGNRFRIAVREVNGAEETLISHRLTVIREKGVPNYFGAQRFGRDGSNLSLAEDVFAGKRLKRELRSMALSAARSFLFNEILSSRVTDGSWEQALPGDALNLNGTGSFFIAEEIDDEVNKRLQSLDVHPTGALWGRGDIQSGGQSATNERRIADSYPEIRDGLERAGLDMARRTLRLAVTDLQWEIDANRLWLEFSLGRGSYATAVLREIVSLPGE